MNWATVVIMLFLIMDPIGNIQSFLSMLKELPPKRQYYIIGREMLIALGIMSLFSLIGDHIFVILQISETGVKLASGMILFLVALQILFPTGKGFRVNLPNDEPFVIPLAIPLIAGPSLLATILLFSHLEPSSSFMLTAIFAAWLAASGVLLFANQFKKILGDNGLLACEKLMAMILILLAMQRFMDGVQSFLEKVAGA